MTTIAGSSSQIKGACASPSGVHEKRKGPVAISLIGAAIICGLAQGEAALAQTYVAKEADLASTTTSGVVTLGGYYNLSDGGGGTLVPGASGCTPDNATIFIDHGGNCLYRATTTNNVREWGAHCDVVAIQTKTGAYWDPSLGSHGALVVNKSLLSPAPPVSTGGQYISISQIGGPTLWESASPAMWATRFSQLGGTQANYKIGDLISFVGTTNAGKFSQQIAIIVDSVKSVTVGGVTTNGIIDQWHFLWGGIYDPTVSVDTTLQHDWVHSYCQNVCGAASGQASGATFTPAWSGWSLLNSQTITNAGTGYSIGDVITLDGTTTSVNSGHYPKLVVENVSGGTVTAFDWLDFGSYATLPTNPYALSQYSVSPSGGSNFALGNTTTPLAWTRGPLATKIDHTAAHVGDSSKTDIFLTDDTGAFPVADKMNVLYFYYGSDDGAFINKALISQSASSIASVNGNAFVLPGACGTTVAINLPQDTTANFVNPALVGGNFQSAGLYAFAPPPASRSSSPPVMSRLVYEGAMGAFGGGLQNMFIEGLGIPEGSGFYYLYSGTTSPPGPSGAYVGPTVSGTTPTSGDAIEIDSGKYLRIANVHVSDGGMGPGNSVFQCGYDEANPDPAHQVPSGATGNITVTDSRFDSNSTIAGATNPDIVLRLGNSCHDSAYRNLSVYDGTFADILQYNGNLFSQIHFNSDAANSSTGLAGPVTWTGGNSGFAGVANYGVYALGNASYTQTQCDIANSACIRVLGASANGSYKLGQITDTQMKCGSLTTVPTNYYGVWLGAGTVNTTVSGTAASAKCAVPGSQLVVLDAQPDPTVSICNNSNATVIACGLGSGFAANRWYTQPALAYGTVTLAGPSGSGMPTTLYAVPFFSPSGGPLSKMGIQVTSTGSASHCELGVYTSQGGAPGALLFDGGQVNATGGMKTNSSLNYARRANTLYFLAVGCDGTVTVEATNTTAAPSAGLTGLLMGVGDFTTAPAVGGYMSSWVYATNGLPATFGALTYTAGGTAINVPNVYVGS